jgi:hypothetical protein
VNRLFFNGLELELSDASKIGMTYQVNNIADLQNRSGNFSNIIKIPKTVVNRGILENIDNVNSGSNLPYNQHVIDYFENDIQIVMNGIGVIEPSDKNYYYLRITSGLTNFFDAKMDRPVGRLYDVNREDLVALENDPTLDFRGLYQYWYIDNMIALNDRSSYCIYPIIDHTTDFNLMDFEFLDCKALLPCLFIKDIWERYALISGYELAGSFIDGDIFPLLVLTPDNLSYNQSIIDGTQALIPSNQSLWTSNPIAFYLALGNVFDYTLSTTLTDTLTNDTNDQSTYYYNFDSSYQSVLAYFNAQSVSTECDSCQETDTIGFKGTLQFSYNLKFKIEPSGGTPRIKYGILLSLLNATTGDVLMTEFILDNEDDNYGSLEQLTGRLSYEGIFDPLHEFKLRITVQMQRHYLRDLTFTVAENSLYNSLPSFNISNIVFSDEQTYGGVLFINQLFNIKTKDVFKDVMNQFGLICQVDELRKKVTFSKLDEILENESENWSDKIDLRSLKVDYQTQNYSYKNMFKYAENEYTPLTLGDGEIIIDGFNTNTEATQIELKTSATEEHISEYEDLNIPQIKMINPDKSNNKTNNRILILDPQTVAFDFTYADNTATQTETDDIPFAKFDGVLDFPTLLDENYKTVKQILRKPKKIIANFNLSALDIKNLDFLKPKYLDVQDNDIHIQGLFYLQRIYQYKGGLTQCELIRL